MTVLQEKDKTPAHSEDPDFYREVTPENQERERQLELCKEKLQAKKQVCHIKGRAEGRNKGMMRASEHVRTDSESSSPFPAGNLEKSW